MRKRLCLCAALFSLAISVCATAMPIDTVHFDVTLPTVIASGVLDVNDTAMTHEDFVPAAPYEMVINTIDYVPIDIDLIIDEAVIATDKELGVTEYLVAMAILNDAVKLNTNFERN